MAFSSIMYTACLWAWGEFLPRSARNLTYPFGGYGYMHTRLAEVKNHPPVDIVVLGSSLAYRGFDPREFAKAGYSLFNLGSSGQSFIQTELLVDRYLEPLNPKLVIIEVSPGAFQLEGIESALDIIANGDMGKDMVVMAWRERSIRIFNAMLYSIPRKLLGRDNKFTQPNHSGADTYVSGGFVEHSGEDQDINAIEPAAPAIPRPAQVKAFNRLLRMLRANGRNFVLVEAPGIRPAHNADTCHSRHEQSMREAGPYLNMNGLAGLNELDFYDAAHLNQRGVVIFNLALLDSLGKGDYLPPR